MIQLIEKIDVFIFYFDIIYLDFLWNLVIFIYCDVVIALAIHTSEYIKICYNYSVAEGF